MTLKQHEELAKKIISGKQGYKWKKQEDGSQSLVLPYNEVGGMDKDVGDAILEKLNEMLGGSLKEAGEAQDGDKYKISQVDRLLAIALTAESYEKVQGQSKGKGRFF